MVDQCPHPEVKLREFTASNGVISYRLQCQGCGTSTKSPRKEDVRRRYPTEIIPPWDESIRDRYQEQRMAQWRAESDARRAEREAELAEQSAEWWERYQTYLGSAAWQARRTKVLERDGYRCQAGLAGCRGKANQAHHLTYDHVFREPLFDLISVCATCHELITFFDRERRAAQHAG